NYVSGGATNSDTNVLTQLTYDTANRLLVLLDPMNFDVVIQYGDLGDYHTLVSQLKTNSNTTPSTGNSLYEETHYFMPSDGMGTVASIQGPVDDVAHKSQYQYDSQGNVTQ